MKICLLGDARSIHLQHLAGGLHRHGLHVHIVTHNPVAVEGATVERFAVPPFGWRYPARWRQRWTLYLCRLMRRFEVVNLHFMHDWGITPDITAEGCLVATPWGSDIAAPPNEPSAPPEVVAIRRALLRAANRVTGWGSTFATAIADFARIPVNDIDVLPLGVNVQRFAPESGVRCSDRSRPIVGFYKGFKPVYAATHLIQAIPQVLAECPAASFDLLGDGSERETCRALADRLGIAHAIRWLDRVRGHDDLARLVRRWDLVVIPSLQESLCLTALEAAASGVPVVASRVGGLTETVAHEETGLLVEPENPPALADGIVALLNDPARRRAMGRQGRQMVIDRYQEDRCLGRWVAFYKQATESHGGQAATPSAVGGGNAAR